MKKVNPYFTIVTISYNSEKWITQAVDSVLNSDFSDFEYLVIDDCSSDTTLQKLFQYRNNISLISNKINIGEYQNRNKALFYAQGKYILYVDADDILFPNTLSKLYSITKKYPDCTSYWGGQSKINVGLQYPLRLTTLQVIEKIYIHNQPIYCLGLSDTLFNLDFLKNIGGFSNIYVSGDVFAKKILSLLGDILLIDFEFMTWRIHEFQASNKLSMNHLGYFENISIDKKILSLIDSINPDKNLCDNYMKNIDSRDVKLFYKKIFLSFDIRLIIKAFNLLRYKIFNLNLLFHKWKF